MRICLKILLCLQIIFIYTTSISFYQSPDSLSNSQATIDSLQIRSHQQNTSQQENKSWVEENAALVGLIGLIVVAVISGLIKLWLQNSKLKTFRLFMLSS